MDVQTAQFLLHAITTAAGIVWVLGLYFLAQSARTPRTPPGERFELDQPQPKNVVMGTVEIVGKPRELLDKALKQIASNQAGFLGISHIAESSSNQITFQGLFTPPPVCVASIFIQQGKLIFSESMAGRTRVDYVIIAGNTMRIALIFGAVTQLLGLIAICAGFALISVYIIPAADPAFRWQTLQMLQVVHLLWPPFMFGMYYRRRFNEIHSNFTAFLHNLPYLKDQ